MGNWIEGNRIENLYVGVLVFGSDNTIGGIAEGAGNVIADSAFAGVAMSTSPGLRPASPKARWAAGSTSSCFP